MDNALHELLSAGDLAAIDQRAQELFEAKRYVESRFLLESVVNDLDPTDAPSWINLGSVCEKLGDDTAAHHAYTAAAKLGSVEALASRGLLLERMGRPAEARRDYLEALAGDPNDVDTLVNLGTLELELDNVDAARGYLAKALELDETTIWQWAEVLVRDGLVDEAVDALNRAIALGEERAYLDLAEISRDRGDYERAEHQFAKAIEAGASGAPRKFALFLDQLGQYTKAQKYFHLALEDGDEELGDLVEKSLSYNLVLLHRAHVLADNGFSLTAAHLYGECENPAVETRWKQGVALYDVDDNDADHNEAAYEIFAGCWREGYCKNEWMLHNAARLSDRVADLHDLVTAEHPAHLELEALNIRGFIARAACDDSSADDFFARSAAGGSGVGLAEHGAVLWRDGQLAQAQASLADASGHLSQMGFVGTGAIICDEHPLQAMNSYLSALRENYRSASYYLTHLLRKIGRDEIAAALERDRERAGDSESGVGFFPAYDPDSEIASAETRVQAREWLSDSQHALNVGNVLRDLGYLESAELTYALAEDEAAPLFLRGAEAGDSEGWDSFAWLIIESEPARAEELFFRAMRESYSDAVYGLRELYGQTGQARLRDLLARDLGAA